MASKRKTKKSNNKKINKITSLFAGKSKVLVFILVFSFMGSAMAFRSFAAVPGCAANKKTIVVGEGVTFTSNRATGGNALWRGGGTPSTGVGTHFVTTYGSPGMRTVTLTIKSNGQEAKCKVDVKPATSSSPAPAPEPQPAPNSTKLTLNVKVAGAVGVSPPPVKFTTSNHTLGNCNPRFESIEVNRSRTCTGNTIGNSNESTVNITAPMNPTEGFVFEEWEGNCHRRTGVTCRVHVPVGKSYSVTAVYRTVSSNPVNTVGDGATSLTINVRGLPGAQVGLKTSGHTLGHCNPKFETIWVRDSSSKTCTGNTIGRSPSSPVNLIAPVTGGDNRRFERWEGSCLSTSGTTCRVYVPVGSRHTVTAIYTPRVSVTVEMRGLPSWKTPVTFTTTGQLGDCPSPFTVTDIRACTGDSIGSSRNSTVKLHAPASPVAGYIFDSWMGGCIRISGRTCEIYSDSGGLGVTANFRKIDGGTPLARQQYVHPPAAVVAAAATKAAPTPTTNPCTNVSYQSSRTTISECQGYIGTPADGIWGPNTEMAYVNKFGHKSNCPVSHCGNVSAPAAPAGSAPASSSPSTSSVTCNGVTHNSSRTAIQNCQKLLKVSADGIWGPNTEAAYKKHFGKGSGWSSPTASKPANNNKVIGYQGTCEITHKSIVPWKQRKTVTTTKGVIELVSECIKYRNQVQNAERFKDPKDIHAHTASVTSHTTLTIGQLKF